MNCDLKQLIGLSTEDRYQILKETDHKYKSIIKELQDITEFIDDFVSYSVNHKENDDISSMKSLLAIIHIQSKLLTDVQFILNKMYNEHSVEFQYIHLNLEILNQNIYAIHEMITNNESKKDSYNL